MINCFLIGILSLSLFSCSKHIPENSIESCSSAYYDYVGSFPMDNKTSKCNENYKTSYLNQDFNKVEFSSPSLYERNSELEIYAGNSIQLDLIAQSLFYTIYETNLQTKITKKKYIEINFSHNQSTKNILQNFFNNFLYCSYETNKNITSKNTALLAAPSFLKFMENENIKLEVGFYEKNVFCKKSQFNETQLMFKHIYLLSPNKVVLSEETESLL